MTPLFLGDWVPMRNCPGLAPDGPSEAPWSITHQAAVFSERAVNLLPPSASSPECQTHFSFRASPFSAPSQGCWCIEIIGPHSVRPGCQRGVWIEISSLVPRLPPDFPFAALSSAFLWGRDGSSSWHGIRGTLSTVAGPPWSCVYRPFFQGLLSLGSLDSLFDMAHIQNGSLEGLLFLQQNSITFLSRLSASLLSYSEFNEGGKIKASLWFARSRRGRFFVSAGGPTQRAFMWNEFFFLNQRGRWLRCLRKSRGVWKGAGH